ncbi:FAD-binding protein [bacterium]|nr:FAD-binding protein [bacterium]
MKKPRVVVLGSGSSGLMATIKFAESGIPVTLVSALPSYAAHSSSLCHGLALPQNPREAGDSDALFLKDIITAADGLADQNSLKNLTDWSGRIYRLLTRLGIAFSTTQENRLDFRPAEGARVYRTLYAGFHTGRRLLYALDQVVRSFEEKGLVTRRDNLEFVSLIRSAEESVCGLTVMNKLNMDLEYIKADIVVAATGGFGQIFLNNTHPQVATGLAVSVLYQQGARLANMEFVQSQMGALHTLDGSLNVAPYALSEGGRFFIETGGKRWYFLEENFPKYRNWVTSDAVHRFLFDKYRDKAKLTGEYPLVYFDLSHRPRELFEGRLKNLREQVKKFTSHDIAHSPVPVSSAVTSTLGGLETDNYHMTNISGLFACGDAGHRYKGAYQPDNMVYLTSLYSGYWAATHALLYASGLNRGADSVPESVFDDELKRQHEANRTMLDLAGQEKPRLLFEELKHWMSDQATVVKDEAGLTKAADKILELKKRFERIKLADTGRFLNEELLFARRLWGALELAQAVVAASKARKESRGCHYRTDYPLRDDALFLKASSITYNSMGPVVEFKDIDQSVITPPHRAYC